MLPVPSAGSDGGESPLSQPDTLPALRSRQREKYIKEFRKHCSSNGILSGEHPFHLSFCGLWLLQSDIHVR